MFKLLEWAQQNLNIVKICKIEGINGKMNFHCPLDRAYMSHVHSTLWYINWWYRNYPNIALCQILMRTMIFEWSILLLDIGKR